jgi:NarL family two-component system response regulator LiaR
MSSETDRPPLRVAIANDYEVVVAGAIAMLAPHADRVVVVETDSRLVVSSDVDVVLCDTFGYVEGEGVDLADLIASGARVVVYSWAADPGFVERALAQGAAGFLSKGLTALELVEALEAVHDGATLPRPETASGDAERSQVDSQTPWPGQETGLTARESEILALIAKGLTNQEIADAVFLSINTVKSHIRTAYVRIGADTRAQAVIWAMRNGFAPVTQRALTQGGPGEGHGGERASDRGAEGAPT